MALHDMLCGGGRLLRGAGRRSMAVAYADLLEVHRDKLPLLDLLLNFFLVTPIVVLHYHATCQVLDYVLVATFPRFGPCLLFVAGISITFTFAYYQKKIPGYVSGYLPLEGENGEVFRSVQSRAYTFILTFVTLSHMKSVTDLFLQSTGGTAKASLRAAVTSIIVLWGMRGSRNILAPPVCLGLDKTDHGYHEFSTAFSTEPSETMESALDTLATIGVAYTMIHLHWTGITSLMDNLLFPDYFWMSTAASLALGYAICLAAILFQHRARDVSRALERQAPWKKLVFEDAYVLVCGFGVINVWRGIWMFYDALTITFPVFVVGTDVTCFLGCLVSFLTLLVGSLTNSLPYKGFDIDGSMKDGEGCLWSTNYIIDLIQELEKESPEEAVTCEDTPSQEDAPSEAACPSDDLNQNSLSKQSSISSQLNGRKPSHELEAESSPVEEELPAEGTTITKANGPVRRNVSKSSTKSK